MMDVFLPSPDETQIRVNLPGKEPVALEVIDIVKHYNDAMEQRKKDDAESWRPYFQSTMASRGIDMSPTACVVLVEAATAKLLQIKKASWGVLESRENSAPPSQSTNESSNTTSQSS